MDGPSRGSLMATIRKAGTDVHDGTQFELATVKATARLLNRTALTAGTLPNPEDIADFLDDADNSPNALRMDLASAGRLTFLVRGGSQHALGFALSGAEGAVATAIVGGFRPLVAAKPDGGDDGRKQRLQWVPFILDEISLVAGSEVGIADGLITENDYWCDTITITKTYRPQPDPERIWGPKDTDGITLAPNNTPVWYIGDFRGLRYGFVYVDLGTDATGAKVIEFPF